jgi:hypothetical protein
VHGRDQLVLSHIVIGGTCKLGTVITKEGGGAPNGPSPFPLLFLFFLLSARENVPTPLSFHHPSRNAEGKSPRSIDASMLPVPDVKVLALSCQIVSTTARDGNNRPVAGSGNQIYSGAGHRAIVLVPNPMSSRKSSLIRTRHDA